MNYARFSVFALVICCSVTALADEASKVEAARMLDAIGMENITEQSIDMSLDAQIVANPKLKPYRAVMRAYLAKYMSYSVMKPQLVDIYASEFTASELAEATAFYSTKTGKKLCAKLPLLMNKGSQLGKRSVHEHISELQAAIKAESERIDSTQVAPDPSKETSS